MGDEQTFGSDVVIRSLAALGIDHVAFNPGASFRGLHESMVHLDVVEGVLCLSEPVAVSVAHGFAKAAERPMAVFLHNLVGLQSGSMGVFNAWIDQAPMLVLGGSGPLAQEDKRPYIDWIHTSRSQSDIVNRYVKWDGAPTSVTSVPDSLHRALRAAMTPPYGPSYVSVDTGVQEQFVPPDVAAALALPSAPPPTRLALPRSDVEEIADKLRSAHRPVLLADNVGRSRTAYDALTRVAEHLQTPVVDLAGRHNLPNTHPLDATLHRKEVLSDADVVLALDVRDTTFGLSEVALQTRTSTSLAPRASVITVSTADLHSRGHVELERARPEHRAFLGDTAEVLPALAALLERDGPAEPRWRRPPGAETATTTGTGDTIGRDLLARVLWEAVREGPWHIGAGYDALPLRQFWDLAEYGAHYGTSGGAGLGYNIGAAIGTALARRGDGLTVAIQPDGDLLYTATGLWTAAKLSLPMLIVVVNNRCYGQDLKHQRAMANVRDRPSEHAHVGIDIDDPAIDFATLASAQGVEGIGPIEGPGELADQLTRATRLVRDERRPVLVEVVVDR